MNFKINAGEFKHHIFIERFINSVSDENIPIKQWILLFKTRAKILNVRGAEAVKASGNTSAIEKTFYIRFTKKYNLNSKDRIIYNNEIYNIIYVNNIEEACFYLEVKCRKCD